MSWQRRLEQSAATESGEEKKFDEEEEDEEDEEEDRIIERSHNNRFYKRNKRYMRKIPGIDNSFIAIEPKSGKEVIWNEILLSERRPEVENRFINFVRKLKRNYHPFLVRFLDAWVGKVEKTSQRKMIFITERLTDPTMKQYFVNSSSATRLGNRVCNTRESRKYEGFWKRDERGGRERERLTYNNNISVSVEKIRRSAHLRTYLSQSPRCKSRQSHQ